MESARNREQGLVLPAHHDPLSKDHKILTQVSGHASHTVKLIPPLIINDEDCDWIVRAFDDVIADSHRAGAVWSLGKTLVDHAMRG